MTKEERADSGSSDILTRLSTAGVRMQQVEPGRQLVTAELADHPMAEFIAPDFNLRLLAVPESSPDAATRAELELRGVSVPNKVGEREGIGLWSIPEGAHSLAAMAHLIADDPSKYGGMLYAIGEAHRQAVDVRMGVAAPVEGVRMIDRFIIAPDVYSDTGVKVLLIPPYNFDASLRRDAFAHQIIDEFAALPNIGLRPQQLMTLGQQLQEGGGGI